MSTRRRAPDGLESPISSSAQPPAEARSDEELVAGCAEGDARAWKALVERYRRLVYTIPYRMGLDPADADEVFQITFTRLVGRVGALRDGGRVRAWLVTTTRRVALDLIARARQGDPEALEGIQDPRELPSEEVERLQDQELVRVALARLGKRCRDLLTLLYYREGASAGPAYEAAAKELGIPLGSVGPTRIRCLRKLIREFAALSDG